MASAEASCSLRSPAGFAHSFPLPLSHPHAAAGVLPLLTEVRCPAPSSRHCCGPEPRDSTRTITMVLFCTTLSPSELAPGSQSPEARTQSQRLWLRPVHAFLTPVAPATSPLSISVHPGTGRHAAGPLHAAGNLVSGAPAGDLSTRSFGEQGGAEATSTPGALLPLLGWQFS